MNSVNFLKSFFAKIDRLAGSNGSNVKQKTKRNKCNYRVITFQQQLVLYGFHIFHFYNIFPPRSGQKLQEIHGETFTVCLVFIIQI